MFNYLLRFSRFKNKLFPCRQNALHVCRHFTWIFVWLTLCVAGCCCRVWTKSSCANAWTNRWKPRFWAWCKRTYRSGRSENASEISLRGSHVLRKCWRLLRFRLLNKQCGLIKSLVNISVVSGFIHASGFRDGLILHTCVQILSTIRSTCMSNFSCVLILCW